MMLPYTFSPFLFLRSPAYSIEDFGAGNLLQILQQDFFRTALYFSSPDLYKQLKDRNFEARRLTKGMEESLLRYFNRMSYRATPFGMFAAFSHAKWGDGTGGLTFSGKEELTVQVDYRLSRHIASGAILDRMPVSFYSNPSIYSLGNELRFIKSGMVNGPGNEIQGLSAAANSRFLTSLIRLSKDGIGSEELKEFLSEQFPKEDPEDLIRDLLAEELLYSEFVPNVTGENYLKRISRLSKDDQILQLVESLDLSGDLPDVNPEKMESLLATFIGDAGKIRSPYYVNYEREVCGNVATDYQKNLMNGLYGLSRLQSANEKSAISRFKKRFAERFEEQEILLMLAMDPEAGIGYEFLEETAENGELLRGITFEEPKESKQIAWGPLQEMLMNKLSLPINKSIIELTDDDLEGLAISKVPHSPGLSVIFRLVDDKVFIESAGGSTATALIGRFTSFSDTILTQARALADAEQAANPEILFAEIAYSTEEHASNINTRQHVRDYEIPVLVHSTLRPENVIGLNDLYVSVYRNEIVLRSAKHRQRIVPRLSTAYNHIRSELPVFRFLSDLQYQGIAAGLSFKPEKLLPGRAFYPRIEYKNCILSEAAWVIKRIEIKKICDVPSFLDFAMERHISRYFALSESDKQLVFDLNDHQGLELLLSQIKNAGQIILREFFVEGGREPLLKDDKGKTYTHQLIAYLVNNSMSYSYEPAKRTNTKNCKRYESPGDKWIYFKIYCSPQSANNILLSKVYAIIRKHSARVDKWFFIRYHDPGHHLRVRIHGSNELISEMPRLFNTMLKGDIQSGLISSLQIDTYVREIERYGPETIDQAELVFLYSSELVVQYLSGDKDEIEIIQFALISTHFLLHAFNMDVNARIVLLEKICESLMNEQGSEKILRNDLNKKYREHQQLVQECLSVETDFFNRSETRKMHLLCSEIKKLDGVLNRSRPPAKVQIASDILHMHMNRIFSAEQRKKELVIYYMCLRYYISLRARGISPAAKI